MHRAKSAILSEKAFYNAAVKSSSQHDVGDDDDALTNNVKSVAVAKEFLSATCPALLRALERHPDAKSSTDRLVKVGRNVSATLKHASSSSVSGKDVVGRTAKTDASLRRLVSECQFLAKALDGSEESRLCVPKVRFGKTELQMPILTLGCMRFQQSWNRDGGKDPITSMEQVEKDCQDNLVNIIKYAISMGVNHIETALGYGCSELQIGAALKMLFESGDIKRKDLIIQTKGGISANTTPEQFRQTILDQIDRLGLDYVDLFSVHGANTLHHFDWLYNHAEAGNLIEPLRQLKKEGRIRHVGFSTHAPAEVIAKFITEGDDFDYLNLHHHFCGDYTASGDGALGGNLENVRLANARDMGVFIISPYDKGGRLYAPPNKLRDLTLPEFEPMEYGSQWLWNHGRLDEGGEGNGSGGGSNAQPHTIVCGAARPSDLDQPIFAALRAHDEETFNDIRVVADRLYRAAVDELGENWVGTWHVGLPNCTDAAQGTQMGNMVWLHNVIKSYGLLDFAKDRYAVMETNLSKWDNGKSKEENIEAMGPGWPWMPGCGFDPERDYSEDLTGCPPENVQRVKEAMAFVHKWCAKKAAAEEDSEEKKDDMETAPVEWQTAYDMRPWTAFPERG